MNTTPISAYLSDSIRDLAGTTNIVRLIDDNKPFNEYIGDDDGKTGDYPILNNDNILTFDFDKMLNFSLF